jgi:hypothetical protein
LGSKDAETAGRGPPVQLLALESVLAWVLSINTILSGLQPRNTMTRLGAWYACNCSGDAAAFSESAMFLVHLQVQVDALCIIVAGAMHVAAQALVAYKCYIESLTIILVCVTPFAGFVAVAAQHAAAAAESSISVNEMGRSGDESKKGGEAQDQGPLRIRVSSGWSRSTGNGNGPSEQQQTS